MVFKIGSPYKNYLDRLQKKLKKKYPPVMEINNNGDARRLGKIARNSNGALKVVRERNGKTYLMLKKRMRKVVEDKKEAWYDLLD